MVVTIKNGKMKKLDDTYNVLRIFVLCVNVDFSSLWRTVFPFLPC